MLNLPVGLGSWPLEIPEAKRVLLARTDGEPRDPRQLVRDALEAPFHFEPMRRAMTPDDRVAIVLDASLPHAAELLAGVFDHLGTASIAPAAVSVLTPQGSSQSWIDDLPDEFADVTAETHDPTDRKKLAYLATTKDGRRVYLNRTLVESEFIIALTGRRFDPVRRYDGAEIALFPTLSDEETIAANAGPYSKQQPWPGREESHEVAWLLGTPFLVQVIEGGGDTVHAVVAGLLDSSDEGRKRQDARWRFELESKADAAIAAIAGDPANVTFLDLAKAAATAARAVRKGGRIALLTEAAPALGEGAETIRRMDEPRWPSKSNPPDWAACKRWCAAAGHASIFLKSGLADEIAEELFATPLASPREVQRLVESAGSVVVIPDANKARVEVKE
ncbi:MAG: lactate racemase domain-containing protein [Gemmataceae bacterium]